MNKNPLISVIVPVYNTEQYVRRCIDSLLRQTYSNLEIIIVDDSSTGDIKEIVAEYKKENQNIILISHKENKGLFQARITGLKAMNGDYFAFVDSDDWVGIDFYRVLIKKALETNSDIVAADRLEAMEEDSSYYAPNDMMQQVNWKLQGKKALDLLMEQKGLDYGVWVVWNKLYARHIWEENRELLEEQKEHLIMCEDIAFSTAFFSKVQLITNIHNNYYYYYRNDNSSTIQSCSASKYQKNLKDIELAFSLSKKVLLRERVWEIHKDDWQKWKNSIVEGWENRIKNDKKLKIHEKKQLESQLQTMIADRETEPCNKDRSFCTRGTKWHTKELYEEIKQEIAAKECRVVSFDMFDTLVQRPFFQPMDLFHMLDSYINEFIPSTDYLVFTNIRMTAEQRARERKRINNPSWEEITLEEIYQEVATLCPELSPYLGQICNKEIELELKYCNVRESGRELLECALAAGKRVICTSDMYLSADILKQILKKNGIDQLDHLYVSSEIGLTKSTGALYTYVLKREMNSNGYMVHIGDNWNSDVIRAKEKGIHSFHLPKATDLFMNGNGGIYSGQYYYRMIHEQKGLRSTHAAFETWGIRCMMAVAANKIFDNPFVIWNPSSDFNGDPYVIGYFALGMHIYSISDWLLHSVKEERFENLGFMARDGYLPYHAFHTMNRIYHENVNTHYLYLSRKAILPLMLINREIDFYTLYNTFNLGTLSPKKFLKIVSSIVSSEKTENQEAIFQKHRIPYERNFGSIESFMEFGKVFFEEFYSDECAQQYKKNFSEYFAPKFAGKSATFDVGYNARCESILQRNFGYDITAHYIHTNNDRPFGRVEKSGIKLKNLYSYSPFITGIMREQLLSEIAPSCIGYRETEGKFGPVFEKLDVNFQTWFVTHTMQQAALEFVEDMVQLFGEDIKRLAYRFDDASLPIEYWLHNPKWFDQDIFRGTLFEDDMWAGNHKSLVDFWNQELYRWGAQSLGAGNILNYDAYPFWRRWLLIFATNWGEGKRRVLIKLENHPILKVGIMRTYTGIRGVYRFFHKQ